LKVGDVVLINGPLVTGRDAAHHYLMHHDSPYDLRGAILYHCGPVMLKEGNTWRTNAAGPTTSIREEPYEADIIKRFGLRAVMGKGGMGTKTLAALKESGAVYLHAIGGAAQFYARCLPKVNAVYLLEELGVPEAMWVFEARDFPAIVTMDAHGNSLHEEVAAATGAELEKVGKL
jgi:fumarate hydratase class I